MPQAILIRPRALFNHSEQFLQNMPPYARRTFEEAGNGQHASALFRFQSSRSAFGVEFRHGLVEQPSSSEINMVFEQVKSNPQTDSGVRNSLFTALQNHFWFYNPYWFEKGLADSLFRFSFGNGITDMVCYAPEGKAKICSQADKISGLIEFFSQAIELKVRARGELVLSKVRYILVDDQEFRLMSSPKRAYMNGCFPLVISSFDCLPGADGIYLTKSPFVRKKFHSMHVPRLEASLIHELAHVFLSVSSGVLVEWKKLFGWIEDRKGNTKCAQPERCITEYQRTAPEEDFADSVVQFYFGLRGLDSEKREFLEPVFSGQRVKVSIAMLEPGQEGLTYTIRYEVRQLGS